MVSITNLVIEQPNYIKYLVFLGVLSVDSGVETLSGETISFTKGISAVLSTITGINFGLTAKMLLLLALIIGTLMAVLFLQGALGRK